MEQVRDAGVLRCGKRAGCDKTPQVREGEVQSPSRDRSDPGWNDCCERASASQVPGFARQWIASIDRAGIAGEQMTTLLIALGVAVVFVVAFVIVIIINNRPPKT